MKRTRRTFIVIYAHILHCLKKSYKDNVPALAGQSTFFLILSAVPFLMFAFSLISIITGTDIESFSIPEPDAQKYPFLRYILDFIIDSVHRSNTMTLIITAVVTLWSAGKGMYCITDGIMRIYRIPNKTLWIFRRIFSMGYTAVVLLIMLLGLAFILTNVIFADFIAYILGSSAVLKIILQILFYLLFGAFQAFLLTLALKIFLRGRVKNKRYRTIRALFPGMALTVVAWNLLTYGVVIYVRNFAVSSIYGSLTSIFIAMIWVYFIMYILLYGVQIDFIYRSKFSGRSRERKQKAAAAANN